MVDTVRLHGFIGIRVKSGDPDVPGSLTTDELIFPLSMIKCVSPMYEQQKSVLKLPTKLIGQCVVTLISGEQLVADNPFNEFLEALSVTRMPSSTDTSPEAPGTVKLVHNLKLNIHEQS
jgi:hypothetical protein